MRRKKKRTIPRWKKLLVAALGTAVIGGGALATGNLPYFKGEKVIEVYDGDTFIIENQTAIRLFGLDAPELPNCMGREAKLALSKLVLGKHVQIREPMADKNRRVLALVYVDNILVNDVMIRAGLAQYTGQVSSQIPRMRSANEYARNNKIGIYSPTCFQTIPPDPNCVIKGNYDYRQRKKIYTMPGCNFYVNVFVEKHQGDAWFCTEAEARKAGFTKSDTCK